jgi:hypothetical protein
MMHLERRHNIVLAGPIDRVFSLFTPAGETLWVPGWNPEFLHPAHKETQEGMVFRTGHGNELTLWSCITWDPVKFHVRYVRVTPASRFGFVDVACRASGSGQTEATVNYTFTALNDDGAVYLSGLTEDAFTEMIDDWQVRIDEWLRENHPSPESRAR